MPIEVTMPALSPTMTEGTLARWVKKEGDAVSAGDVIAEIETDKATMEVEAVDEGRLARILVPEGTADVRVNARIAVLLEDGEEESAIEAFLSGGGSVSPAPAPVSSPGPTTVSSPAPVSAPSTAAAGARVFASPLARRMAAQGGIDLSAVKGTGPGGRIVKADVQNGAPKAAPISAAAAPASSGPDAKTLSDLLGMAYTEIPNSGMRKTIAARLSESKQTVPHFYLTVECVLDSLLEARKQINTQADGAYKLSVNDFVIKACAMALKTCPAANVAWTDQAILQYQNADISVAVATPAGLITPIIKAAEGKGLREISEEMKDLAKRARDGKLKPVEYQGGTFSLSNLGMFGIESFSAIINPPQACILAVGAGVEKPVVSGGKLEIATVMRCTLSIDHRAVDGAVGAEFLQVLKSYIENPISMIV